jgi:hypothetical protein
VDDRSVTPTSPLLNVGNTRLRNYTPVSIDESSIEDMGSARKRADGKLKLLQPGLIQKIVADCGLQDGSHTHDIPAETKILQCDPLGAPLPDNPL